jgi:protein-disulfide isomerase
VRLVTIIPFLAVLACGSANTQTPSAPIAGAHAATPVSDDVPDTVATINGEPITRAELAEAAASDVLAAKQALHEARDQALQQLIVDRLLAQAAEKAGTDIEGLLKIEIEAKLADVSDADIEAFYTANQAQMPGPIEMVRDRIREHLTNESGGKMMQQYIEDLKTAAAVETFLQPFRVDVASRATTSMRGNPDAPIHIIEFSDFQCPYCTRGADTMAEVMEAYGDKVKFEFRHFPLDFHDRAHRAAEASECANEQGKFWEFHDLVFANQKQLGEEALQGYATEAGADVAAFDACMASGQQAKTVDDDMAAGALVGMQGTPGFYINGRVLSGAQPFSAFKTAIDAELKTLGLQ